MGKYASTRAIQGNKAWRSTANTAGNGVFGNITDESTYSVSAFLYNADPTGLYRGYIQARDTTRWMRDYLANRGLKWSDIKYPSLTLGYIGGATLGRSAMTFSRNVTRLYR